MNLGIFIATGHNNGVQFGVRIPFFRNWVSILLAYDRFKPMYAVFYKMPDGKYKKLTKAREYGEAVTGFTYMEVEDPNITLEKIADIPDEDWNEV